MVKKCTRCGEEGHTKKDCKILNTYHPESEDDEVSPKKKKKSEPTTPVLSPRKEVVTKDDSPSHHIQKELTECEIDFVDYFTKNKTKKSKDYNHEMAKRVKNMMNLQKKLFSNSFSKWTRLEVLKLFEMDEVPYSNFTKGCSVTEKHKEIAKEIQVSYNHKISIFGKMNSGKERKRSVFISDLVAITLSRLQIRILVEMEEELDDHPYGNGPVDFVFHARDLGGKIAMIIEAKKDDFDQGEAQLLLELHATKSDRHVFGFVSNARDWVPYVLTKERCFFVGEALSLSPTAPSIDEIAKVVCVLDWMCSKGSLEQIK